MSVRDAAEHLGINRHTAAGWLRKAGVRPQGRPGRFDGTPRRRHPARDRYEQLRADGWTRADAAEHVGIHPRTAQDWDKGVRRSGSARLYTNGHRTQHSGSMLTKLHALPLSVNDRYLSLPERETIQDRRRDGWSIRRIAQELGRSPSTISRELRRHSNHNGTYGAYAAHRSAAVRRRRPKERKLRPGTRLWQAVIGGLSQWWSPEQVAGRLTVEHPDDEDMRVCHETIYQAMYVQGRGNLREELALALRSGRARRRRQKACGARRARFVDEPVLISQRPAEVEDRAVPGHWEGDLIIGQRGKSAIATLVERQTRFVMLAHLQGDHTAQTVRDALVETMGGLDAMLRGSLTWDQGVEMAQHRSFTLATDIPVYFCDPGSPWQRGSNENTNGLLRQYFPKGTDLSPHTREDLEYVAGQLNGRPRKTLGWATPAERLRELLTSA
ncbi:IS30 family transposase [Brevibacterium litoralis]|uniref:IS30 family transposase n=1 Tax=Brevibacterium litoralis TaxID=3138935 RepID=UPI003D9A5C75